jgi:hypothetical protein
VVIKFASFGKKRLLQLIGSLSNSKRELYNSYISSSSNYSSILIEAPPSGVFYLDFLNFSMLFSGSGTGLGLDTISLRRCPGTI